MESGNGASCWHGRLLRRRRGSIVIGAFARSPPPRLILARARQPQSRCPKRPERHRRVSHCSPASLGATSRRPECSGDYGVNSDKHGGLCANPRHDEACRRDWAEGSDMAELSHSVRTDLQTGSTLQWPRICASIGCRVTRVVLSGPFPTLPSTSATTTCDSVFTGAGAAAEVLLL